MSGNSMGFVTEAELTQIAAGQSTRLRPILVRCGGCRFVAPADQIQHLIDIIEREGSDYVRDVSLVAGWPGSDPTRAPGT